MELVVPKPSTKLLLRHLLVQEPFVELTELLTRSLAKVFARELARPLTESPANSFTELPKESLKESLTGSPA